MNRSPWRVQARGEYLIGTRRSKLSRWPAFPAARLRTVKGAEWSNGPHAGTRRYAVLFANHRVRKTVRRLRLMVNHSPSDVQVGPKWRDLPDRVNPYQRGIHRWGRWIARTGRRAPRVVQVAGLDSNLEQHLEVWRDYLEEELGLRSVWHDQQPKAGTHGRRLIDAIHTNAEVVDADVVDIPRDHDLDHDLVYADVVVDGITIRVAQISLRFDVEPVHVADYIRRAVDELDLDVFLCTEAKGRAKAVRKRLAA
jgi:hypothetical protein